MLASPWKVVVGGDDEDAFRGRDTKLTAMFTTRGRFAWETGVFMAVVETAPFASY